MKKVLALVMILAISFCLVIPAFAESVDSPSADVYYTVTYYGVNGIADGSTASVKKDSNVTINAKSGSDPFIRWNIAGTYAPVNGSETDIAMTLKVQSDLVITGVYKSTVTDTDSNQNGGYDVTIVSGLTENPDGDNSAQWIGGHAFVTYDSKRNELTATADPSKGTFNSWSIYVVTYTPDGKKVYNAAVAGKHFKIVVNGNPLTEAEMNSRLEELLASNRITIIPLADIVICGNYNGKITSPKTFDYTPYFMILALLALAGVAFSTKKALSK
ncbi:MAG: hypothetical protein J5766_03645 [Clostridia bacterium]|nr:hypothetical protein [Clostridia bacterium]